jgi:C4-dicarboxylate-specific signal transduction histidine kinase
MKLSSRHAEISSQLKNFARQESSKFVRNLQLSAIYIIMQLLCYSASQSIPRFESKVISKLQVGPGSGKSRASMINLLNDLIT